MALAPNDRSVAGFTMTGHALVHWFETSIPIFLVVWLAEFDVSVTVFGLVVAAGYAPLGLGALPAGVLSDRFGPKRLVVVCLAGMSGAFFLLSLADSVVGIGLALVCWGVAASIYHPAGLALISTAVEDRGRVFAWHGIAGNVGIALGPFVAATLLLVGFEWSQAAALLAVPGVVAAAYGLRADFDPTAAVGVPGDGDSTTEPVDERRSTSALIADSRALFSTAFVAVFAIVTVEGLYYRGMLTYLPEVLHRSPALEGVSVGTGLRGFEPADYVYVGLLVVGMAGQYVGGRLTDRLRPERGLLYFFVVFVALAVAFVPVSGMGLAPVLALAAVFGFCLFAIQPFYQEAVAVYTPAESRGLSYGYTYLGEFGLGAGAIAIGGFALGLSMTVFFLSMAGFAVLGVCFSLLLAFGLRRFSGWRPRGRVRVTSEGE